MRLLPAAIYLPFHPRANRLVQELRVYAPTPEAAQAHALQVTQGAKETTVEAIPEG